MTTTEFNNEFDILYNSIASNAAPSLDSYEKSVFLTQSQEDYVRNIATLFDSSEMARKELSNLVVNGVSVTPLSYPGEALNQRSRFFNLNSDVMRVVNERVKLSSSDSCLNNIETELIPVRHDEYYKQLKNPFKKPDSTVSWRIDYKDISTSKNVEILTVENSSPSEYRYRYIKYPRPIILENLTGLTIRGLNTVTECELSDSVHKKILDGAVELALEAMGNPRLQSKMSIDNKNV